ncbi:hypothetical protein N2152v2_009868 [Parachlorella kessleri]
MTPSITDVPLEVLSVLVEPLGTADRQGARIPRLWASLQFAVPDSRLPQLAAWLDKEAPTICSLDFDFQLQKGDCPALAAALEQLSRCTCLRLTDRRDRYWHCSPGCPAINFEGLALRSLRRLDVATSGHPLIQADVSLRDSLEDLNLSSDCHLGYVHAPPSLTRLAVPLKVSRAGNLDWDRAFGPRAMPLGPRLWGMPRLRELQIFCSWSDSALWFFDDSALDRNPGQGDGELLHLMELEQLAPGLEVLAVDCSEAPWQNERYCLELGISGGQRLPKGLRSLTVTELGFSSSDFLQGLSALLHLTQLCLPKCRMRAVPRALEGLTQVKEVQLSCCNSNVVGPTLAPLRALPRLQRLSLAGCDLRGLAPEELVREGWPALQVLNLASAKVPG